MNLNNISQIRYMGDNITLAKLNGDILYKRGDTPVEPIEKEYAIEYTISARNSTDTLDRYYTDSYSGVHYYSYLPRIYSSSSWSITGYDRIEITKKDDTITDDIKTLANSVKKIKIWYPISTRSIKFYGYVAYNSECRVSSILNPDRINLSNITSMSYMFHECSKLTSLDVSNWDTGNVTSMSYMFYGCTSLTSLDLSNFNTSNVTYMGSMFYDCTSLTSLDVSNWDTSKVTSMTEMFWGCYKLTSLDASNWDTSKVKDMGWMFNLCHKLTSLDISNWDMTKASYTSMFGTSLSNTPSLRYIDLSESNDSTITKIVNGLHARTEAGYGEMLVPKNTSQNIINSMVNKYWKPIGGIELTPTSVEIAVDLEEIVGIGERSKVYYVSYSPWCSSITNTVELISSDDSIAYINGNNEIITASYGSVEIYVRLKSSGEIISNVVTINVYENDPYPYEIKFKADLTTTSVVFINVNGSDIALSSMKYNANTKVYSYDVGEKLTSLKFNNNKFSGLEFIKIDTSNVTSMKEMFKSLNALKTLDISKFNTSNVTDMTYMFCNCSKLTSLDVSNFDTSNVTDMGYMFYQCSSLASLDLSNFDTSSVTNMYQMFYSCSSLTSLNISNFNTSKVTVMTSMFCNCSKLTSLDVSNFDTSNVTDIQNMFQSCSSLTSLDLSNFNTSKVTSMSYIFYQCSSLASLDLSNFNTSKIKNKSQILYNVPLDIDFHYNGNNYENWTLTEEDCSYKGIFQWNLPTDLQYSDDYYVDYTVCRISEPLDYLHIRKLGIPAVCINGGQTYNFQKIEITKHDGTKTDDTSTPCNLIRSVRVYYPESCEKVTFEGLVSPILVSVSSDTTRNYYNFFENIISIRTCNFTDMEHMFYNCSSLTSLDASNWDTSNVKDMGWMFCGCDSLTSLDASNWDTSNVTSMYYMFYGCSSLTSLDLSNWDTSNVTSIYYMFYGCTLLTSLDVSKWNTSKVEDMCGMFSNCPSLTSLDLSSFDTSSVTNMSSMFDYCTSLTSLDLSNFNTSNVTDMSSMFRYCSASINGGYNFAIRGSCNNMFEYFSGSIYDIGYGEVQSASYMFAYSNIDDYTFSNTFYYNCNFSGCSNMSYMFYNCTNLSSFYFNDSSYHSTYSLQETSYMFAGCTNLSELYINYMYTSNVWSYDGMFNDVYGSIYIGSDFTLTESDTGYSGTFIWY